MTCFRLLFVFLFLTQAVRGEEKVVLTSPDEPEIKLAATVFLPAALAKAKSSIKNAPAPTVIYIHDFGKNQEELKEVALMSARKGIAGITVDLRGHGLSVIEKTSAWESLNKENQTKLSESFSKDVQMALERIQSYPSVSKLYSIVAVGKSVGLALKIYNRDTKFLLNKIVAIKAAADPEVIDGLKSVPSDFQLLSFVEKGNEQSFATTLSGSSISVTADPKVSGTTVFIKGYAKDGKGAKGLAGLVAVDLENLLFAASDDK